MKTLVIILTSLSLFGCFTKDFEVVDATSQKWIGGIPGAGKGTNYEIKVLAFKNSARLQIDKIWIGEEYYDISALKDSKKTKDTSFEKMDTLYIKVHKYIRTDREGVEIKTEVDQKNKLPKEYVGEALIGFTYKGKRKYKTIGSFKKLKFIPYQ